MINSPSLSLRTTSETPIVSLSRDFCEVVRLFKMNPSLYQEDFNIEPVILWTDIPYKADYKCICVLYRGQHRNFDITVAFLLAIINFLEGIFARPCGALR